MIAYNPRQNTVCTRMTILWQFFTYTVKFFRLYGKITSPPRLLGPLKVYDFVSSDKYSSIFRVCTSSSLGTLRLHFLRNLRLHFLGSVCFNSLGTVHLQLLVSAHLLFSLYDSVYSPSLYVSVCSEKVYASLLVYTTLYT